MLKKQLMNMKISPKISIVTNITPNHLNIHEDMEEYIEAKKSIIKYQDKDCACITGTKEELQNYKHYVFNNKLPLFINIIMTIDQHNNSLQYVPWLVDRVYTDEDIYNMYGFTQEEKEFIDETLKRFERNSEWFMSYMKG